MIYYYHNAQANNKQQTTAHLFDTIFSLQSYQVPEETTCFTKSPSCFIENLTTQIFALEIRVVYLQIKQLGLLW